MADLLAIAGSFFALTFVVLFLALLYGMYRLTLRRGLTPLHKAAEAGDEARIRSLILEGVDINVNINGRGTPLMLAVYRRRHEAVRALLSLGARTDAADKLNQTALHYAAMLGDETSTRLLLDAGAPREPKSRLMNKTAMELAELMGHPEVARLIRDYKDPYATAP